MNESPMIAALIAFTLISAVSLNIVYAQQAFPSSTVQLRKTASGMMTTPTPSSSTPPQPAPMQQQQHVTKIKIISPTRDQQVPVGKDLTVSGISIDNAAASTNDCKVSVIVNKVRPYQPATPATAGSNGGAGSSGGGGAGATDYSKWNFVLTSKYTTIKPGSNRITAKYECVNNPALTSFSSVNVTGVSTVLPGSGMGSVTSVEPQSVNGANQRQQTPAITTRIPAAPPLPSLLSQLPKRTNSTGNGISVTTTTNMPIVLRPLPGGSCPIGYHMVSGAVCIKDITPPSPTTTAAPTAMIPTTNVTKSSSFPMPPSSQLNANPANSDKKSADSDNEENFNTKILKSFNKEFKRQNR